MNPTFGGPVGAPGDFEAPPVAPPAQDLSLADLLANLVSQTGTLVRKEIELAKTELAGKATRVLRDAALIGAGLVCSVLASFILLAALVLALGTVMPLWASALLVGVLFAATGIALVLSGIAALKKIDPLPRATVETLQEDRKWVQQLTHR